VGKGTLIKKLMAEHPGEFGFSVSHTTRTPRAGEKDGVHYNFVTKRDMEREIASGSFLEYAHVHGNYYGTSKAAVEKVAGAGQNCILDIDVQGASSVKGSSLPAVFVFIAPPSMEVLERRLRGRGTETEEAVQKRLKNARTEMEHMETPGFYHAVVVNDDLDDAVKMLRAVLKPYLK